MQSSMHGYHKNIKQPDIIFIHMEVLIIFKLAMPVSRQECKKWCYAWWYVSYMYLLITS